ncbi:MAG: cation transporter [Proteobacteria bacterium]|nr:cation transporter [Pseudomonadota bacterium]
MSQHAHEEGHDHAGHGHGGHHGHAHPKVTDEGRIGWAFVIIIAFMAIEVAGGLMSGSLALLADAGHMVSDAAALGMSWAAIRVGKRPADSGQSYGYKRLEVLVAFVNGCALFVVAGWIVFEAARRIASPVHVLGGTMLAVAIAGLLANIVAFLVLNGGNRANLNMRSAWLHVLGDLLGFVVTIIAAGVILETGWSPIDPLLSVFVALMILRSAYGVVKESAHILLEGTPTHLSADLMRSDLLAAIPSVEDVHHIHIWSLTSEQPMVTLHARCAGGADAGQIMTAINQRLREKFGVVHATIQIDPAGDCVEPHC